MDFDPLWLLAGALAIFCCWQAFEDWRLERALSRQRQTEQEQIAQLLVDQREVDGQLWVHLGRLELTTDRMDALHNPQDISQHPRVDATVHAHPDLAPFAHDHTGGVQGHVHWLKYNSTEITEGKRRDVYTCLVPDCKAIISHFPEV